MKFWPHDGLVDWVLTKLFGLPKPYALPIRAFGSKPGDFTWEDWREKAKKEHPIRYFLSETVTLWWDVHVSKNIEHAWYWFRCNTYNRYHMLDLRQPDTGDYSDYRWGWLDETTQIKYACFNILVNYVNEINSSEYNYGILDKDLDELRKRSSKLNSTSLDINDAQLKHLEEVKAIYEYWTIHRKQKELEVRKLLSEWSENKNEKTWDALNKAESEFDNEEDEMLIRLMKIRRGMWT